MRNAHIVTADHLSSTNYCASLNLSWCWMNPKYVHIVKGVKLLIKLRFGKQQLHVSINETHHVVMIQVLPDVFRAQQKNCNESCPKEAVFGGEVRLCETPWAWRFKVTFLGWLSDPYFKWLGDLQLGDQEVTLNHLEHHHWRKLIWTYYYQPFPQLFDAHITWNQWSEL